MNSKRIFWTLWVISLALFFAPVPVSPTSGLGFDKIIHVLIFAALTYFAFAGHRKIAQTIILLGLYSIAVEYVQETLFSYRSFDAYDILAGLAGILLITIIKIPLLRKKAKT